jgi:hypothetical protein
MADQPSPRRRFQFRLRTLMIGVTLLAVPCAYVGWQVKIVRARNAMMIRLRDLGGVCNTPDEIRDFFSASYKRSIGMYRLPVLPWIRRWLGDQAVYQMWIPESAPSHDAAEIAQAFPEAIVGRKRSIVASPFDPIPRRSDAPRAHLRGHHLNLGTPPNSTADRSARMPAWPPSPQLAAVSSSACGR